MCSVDQEVFGYELFNNVLDRMPSIFSNIIKKNSNKNRVKVSLFDTIYELSITFEDYFYRLIERTDAECNTVLYSFALIDELCQGNKVIISNENIHKLFFTSLYISIKLLEDEIFNENHFVEVSGLSNKEIARLEKEFLDILRFNIIIKKEKFDLYVKAFK